MSQAADKLKAIIVFFLEEIKKKRVPVEKVFLFGSHAKGTAGPYSDIDLILVSPVFSGMHQWERWELLGEPLAKVLEPIEILAYSPEEFEMKKIKKTSFLNHILEDSETIEYVEF